MKHVVVPKRSPLESLDGPPLDYSFRNLRRVAYVEIEVGFNNPSNKSAPQEKKEVPKQMFITNQPPASENELTEQLSDPKLNIIRTIEVIDTKIHESVKNSNSKNAEKQERKEVLQVHPKTTSLFLRYNKLTSLDGLRDTLKIVFPAYEQLMWIDLSHNRLTVLVDDFQALPLLKNLYLHANYINNFKELEKLVPVKLLRTFTIHGNPIENYSQFRVLIASMLPQLQKIDSALLTKRQLQRSQVLKKQNKKYPQIVNPQPPPAESQNEDDS